MISLPFPTGEDALRPGAGARPNRQGHPVSAHHCRCDHPCSNDETCLWCGRLPLATIRASWALRALVLNRVEPTWSPSMN